MSSLFWIVYTIIYLLSMAYAVFSYIGMSLGGFRMGRKAGMRNPWMFWIPGANAYALGNLADTQASLCEGKSTTFRRKMVIWTIVLAAASIIWGIALSVIMVAATFNGMLDENGQLITTDGNGSVSMVGYVLALLISSLAFLVLYVFDVVIYYKSLYRIYKLYAPSGAAGLLVLSILVSVSLPFVFLGLSAGDPAIPAVSEERTSDSDTSFYSL